MTKKEIEFNEIQKEWEKVYPWFFEILQRYQKGDAIPVLLRIINQQVEDREKAIYKNIRKWLEYKAKETNGMCGVCGGGTVEIRGRYLKDPKRRICPTCVMEIRESVIDNLNTEVAQEKTI